MVEYFAWVAWVALGANAAANAAADAAMVPYSIAFEAASVRSVCALPLFVFENYFPADLE